MNPIHSPVDGEPIDGGLARQDLLWVVNSSSLLTNPPNHAPIELTQVDPCHLAAFLHDFQGHRVGRYFERLIYYWLHHIRDLEIVINSKQIVSEGGKTLGEIDFVFRDEANQLVHWETAVKFYLHLPRENHTGSHFIGPNAADTFERKTRRLFEHQLSISRHLDVAIAKKEPFVKGMIFYHPSESADCQLPERLAVNHVKGQWVRSNELTLLSQMGAEFRVMRKPFWLSDHAADDDSFVSAELQIIQLREHFRQSDRPVLLSGSCDNQDGNQRVFVVSERWPKS